MGPAEDIALINSVIGSVREEDGIHMVDCDKRETAPTIYFHFKEYILSLNGSDYILDVSVDK